MATLRDIKRKIGSIQSTQTITRTMKMVSASKLRRAQEDMDKFKGYARAMEGLVGRVVRRMPPDSHPLLTPREEVRKVLLFAIASDRGLCGSFNTSIGLHIENFLAQNKGRYESIGISVFGRKLKDYLTRRKVELSNSWTDIRRPDQDFVEEVTKTLVDPFVAGEVDKVYLIYTAFRSPIKQEVVFEEFIPVADESEGEYIDYLCEPERKKILETLLPRYVVTKIFDAFVQSQTSEHAARMSTMENATSNCGEMIRFLTLVYNKRRQESITSEMLDIVGGAEALQGG